MVKSVLGVNHQGLREWVIQHVSASVMAVYSLCLIAYIVTNPELSFAEWHGLFAETWVKVATLVFALALAFHAWIGMWTIFTDYVKNFVVRCILNVGAILMLIACFFWAFMILWSV